MLKRSFAFSCVLFAVGLALWPVRAQSPTAQDLYADALAKEQAVRAAMADEGPMAAVLKAARTVVGNFEAVVQRYPTSGYSDDALWHAGQLSLDAFTKFGEERDRIVAARLLRTLASEYPASKLARPAASAVARIEPGTSRPPDNARSPDTARPPDSARPPNNPRPPDDGRSANNSRPPDNARPQSNPRPPDNTRPPDNPRPAPATEAPGRIATIRDIRRTVLPDAVRVTIELDDEVPFHDERLESPARVFVDLMATRAAPKLNDRTLRFEGDADLVRQVRVGRHPNSTTRVVLDAAGISSYSVYPLYSPYRLVIDCLRARPEPAVSTVRLSAPAAPIGAPILSARSLGAESALPLPVLLFAAGSTLLEARAPDSAPLASTDIAPKAPVTPVRPPTTNLGGGFSIARQLGLGVSRIVIDPGHGGHDPGATGGGTTEAEIVLDVALRLERLLRKAAGVEVVLTRQTDTYVPLQERTMIANREGADLFLSIHANASLNTQASGVETYILNFASNRNAEAVAARENAASGQPMGALPDLVKAIALTNKLDESRDFATYVQLSMVARLKGLNREVRDLGVKQAPFVVLIGAAMPSVLAEISFLTNDQEVRLLKGPAYRERIAEALHDAIRSYQTSLTSQNRVAEH